VFSTGTYGDGKLSDELLWAGTELFLTTGIDSFATAVSLKDSASALKTVDAPSWQGVSGLAWFSLLATDSASTGMMGTSLPAVKAALLKNATSIRGYRTANGYRLPSWNGGWGSNSDYANKGIVLWKAWQISGDTSYRNASLDVLDYLLGRNATGYSFVTGQGSRYPRKIHHRPSGADGIVEPIPGFLVGGPNSQAPSQDKQKYANTTNPAKVYLDVQASYATNEIAINWNAPLAFLAGVWSQHQESVPAGIAARSRNVVPALRTTLANGLLRVDFGGKALKSVELVSLDGKRLARAEGAQAALGLAATGSGMRLVRANAQDGSVGTARLILP
jgi:endoglucanase